MPITRREKSGVRVLKYLACGFPGGKVAGAEFKGRQYNSKASDLNLIADVSPAPIFSKDKAVDKPPTPAAQLCSTWFKGKTAGT